MGGGGGVAWVGIACWKCHATSVIQEQQFEKFNDDVGSLVFLN